MKPGLKLLAATAVVVCSSAAYGQAGVTLYGVVDAGIEYANHQPNGHDVVRMTPGNLSGSRWGLRGTEDLGRGLAGLFVLESGFEADTARSGQGGRLFGRSAYVGLQGQWGSLLLGRQINALFDITGSFDPVGLAPRYSVLVQDIALASRADNTVKYVGKFGALKATAMYSFGWDSTRANGSEVAGNARIGREFGGSLAYTSNNFSIATAYDEINTGTTTTSPEATTRRAMLVGTYSIGNTTLYAGYRWAKAYDGALLQGAPALQPSQRSNLWWAGARWQATSPLTLSAGGYYQDFAGTNADPWLFVASADYAFSKRTDAYLTIGYTKNRNGSTLGLGSGSSGFGTVLAGANQFGTVLGLRHKF
ncbi:porin [Cupriavidus consociatus]|uniref:porin n=1 Tax=Cupriavidus consociatus TaxID=2821357 RepID=UPI001AE19A21|nr:MULTISPECIES: porin [unclassified Cupriavidus]MBP0624378.1 porin [Cupriavidus sp. LEh25]MDK2661093.1 porin [Cupriavidus sp. LEh21]